MSTFSSPFHLWPFWPSLVVFVVLFFLLDLVLRAMALWQAARANQVWWFIALLIFNTMGLLPLIYLLFVTGAKANVSKVTTGKSGNKSAATKKTSQKKS